MAEHGDFKVGPVPGWATEMVADPDDREGSWGRIELSAVVMAMTPDAFRWWLEQELDGLRRSLMNEYFRQMGGE